MKNLNKKALLAMGTIATIAAPIASVVSCSSKGATGAAASADALLNQVNDGKIKIMTGFSKGGQQERALQAQVDTYNATNPKMKVELARIEGGYSAESSNLTTKLEGGDTKTLPNLIVGYGDTLGTIAKYDMQLNLGYGTNGGLRSKFESKFMTENDNVGGIDGTKGTYLVPLGKSTEVNNINSEVIGYLLTQLKAGGAAITGTEVNKFITEAAKHGSEQTKVGAIWGTPNKAAAHAMTITDSIFTSYKDMIDFATQAQDAFANTQTNAGKELHVLGIDAPANLIYEMVYAKLGNKELAKQHSFMFNKGADGYIAHPWKDATTPEGEALGEVYSSLKAGLENGALMMNGGGAYSSQTEVKHKIGMAIGSTAGYSHNYLPGGSTTFKLTVGADKVAIGNTDLLDPNTLTFGSYHNKFILDGDPSDDGYDVSPSAADKAKAQGMIDAAKKDSSIHLAISSADQVAGVDPDDKTKTAVPIKGAILVKSGSHPKYLISTKTTTGISATVLTSDDTLQKDELILKQAPSTYDGTGATSIFSQGPSLIGFHSNDAEDQETIKFVNWLTSTTKPGTMYKAEDPKSKTLESTPMGEFGKESGYISVLKGSFDVPVNADWSDAQKVAFDGFKAAVHGTNARIFTNPVDDSTSEIRNDFDRVLKAQYNIRAKSASAAKSTVAELSAIYTQLQSN